jgi:hypothetical protein
MSDKPKRQARVRFPLWTVLYVLVVVAGFGALYWQRLLPTQQANMRMFISRACSSGPVSITGRVVDPQGAPIAGAEVTFSDLIEDVGKRAPEPRIVYTDAQGQFSYRIICWPEIFAAARAWGYQDATAPNSFDFSTSSGAYTPILILQPHTSATALVALGDVLPHTWILLVWLAGSAAVVWWFRRWHKHAHVTEGGA